MTYDEAIKLGFDHHQATALTDQYLLDTHKGAALVIAAGLEALHRWNMVILPTPFNKALYKRLKEILEASTNTDCPSCGRVASLTTSCLKCGAFIE